MPKHAEAGSSSTIKIRNLYRVFRTIVRYGPLERKDIMTHVNLSWGAVSQYCNQLIDSGLCVQSSNPTGSVGKIPSQIEASEARYALIGVNISSSTIRAALMTIRGNVIEQQVQAVRDTWQVVPQLVSIISVLLEHNKDKKVLTIGISAAGNIDAENGVLLQFYLAPVWKNLQIKAAVEAACHIPTFLVHDTECVLFAERNFGILFQKNYHNVLGVITTAGIGSAMMFDGHIYHGSGNNAGELGHTNAVLNGSLCGCGHRGCLEMYASRPGIVQQYIEAVNSGNHPELDASDLSYTYIHKQAEEGDPFCRYLFRHAGELTGHACASLCTVLEPEAVLFYGDFARDHDLWLDGFNQRFYAEV